MSGSQTLGVWVYRLGARGPKLERTISTKYVPTALAEDPANGNVYVLGVNRSGKRVKTAIYVYRPADTKPFYGFVDCYANDLAFWNGKLFVSRDGSDCAAAIDAFSPAATKPLYSIKGNLKTPTSMTFDPKGDLFVYDNSARAIVEFPLGASKAPLTLTDSGPTFTTNSDGELYASVSPLSCPPACKNYVAHYRANGNELKKIDTRIPNPFGLLTDAKNRLYVVNRTRETHDVQILTASGGAVRSIKSGIALPYQLNHAMAIDSEANLYVANFATGNGGPGNVVVYRPGSSKPWQTIQGVGQPGPIYVGP